MDDLPFIHIGKAGIPTLGFHRLAPSKSRAVDQVCSVPTMDSDSVLKRKGASLVAQWLRVCLPMQGTRVRALVWEDPTCCRAARPVSHNY